MIHERVVKRFRSSCTCGGYAWAMNGRNPMRPHMSWCPQYSEYNEWADAMGEEFVRNPRGTAIEGRLDMNLHARVSAAVADAGIANDGWNARFRAALEKQGLRLVEPKHWIRAPDPVQRGLDAWSAGSMLVMK